MSDAPKMIQIKDPFQDKKLINNKREGKHYDRHRISNSYAGSLLSSFSYRA